MLDQPRVGPGIQQVLDTLRNYAGSSEKNFETLIDYARRLGNGAVFKRLGFLLEREQLADSSVLDACHSALTKGLAKLDPAIASPCVITRWRLCVPDTWAGRADD